MHARWRSGPTLPAAGGKFREFRRHPQETGGGKGREGEGGLVGNSGAGRPQEKKEGGGGGGGRLGGGPGGGGRGGAGAAPLGPVAFSGGGRSKRGRTIAPQALELGGRGTREKKGIFLGGGGGGGRAPEKRQSPLIFAVRLPAAGILQIGALRAYHVGGSAEDEKRRSRAASDGYAWQAWKGGEDGGGEGSRRLLGAGGRRRRRRVFYPLAPEPPPDAPSGRLQPIHVTYPPTHAMLATISVLNLNVHA